jgi:lysophospholipase L1-like esterase
VANARRRWLRALAAFLVGTPAVSASAGREGAAPAPSALYTFGDSILDCGRYNAHGLDPGRLLVRNDDALFPEFRGRDLQSRGPVRLEHRALDGATIDDLARQAAALGRPPDEPAVALLTIGGNDLLRGLARDSGAGLRRFEATLDRFLQALPIRPVLLGSVYDPTFGDDARNFLDVAPALARANLRRVNDIVAAFAARHGGLADIHAHFLRGDPSWFTQTIEPSLIGASEVRRVFLPLIVRALEMR